MNEYEPDHVEHPMTTVLEVLTTCPRNLFRIRLSFWRRRWRNYRNWKRDVRAVAEARAQIAAGDTLTYDELIEELEIIDEVRSEGDD